MLIKDVGLAVSEMVDLVGRSEAVRLMVLEGINPITADKIVRGRYLSQPRRLMAEAIFRAAKAAKTLAA